MTDITAIPTNNLKKIKIIGDFSFSVGDSDGTENTTLEEVDIQSAGVSRSYLDFLRKCTALRILSVKGITATNLQRFASSCSNLEEFTFKNWDTSKVSNIQHLVSSCSKLKRIDVSSLESSYMYTTSYIFYNCTALEYVNMSGWNPATARVASVTASLNYTFQNCTSLKTIDMSGCDFIKTLTVNNATFQNCSSLTTIIGPVSNVMVSFNFSYSPLTRESALVFINGLSDEPSEENPTLTLSSTTKALLTDEDIKIATDKGWTIA